jgi:hypothetical protein
MNIPGKYGRSLCGNAAGSDLFKLLTIEAGQDLPDYLCNTIEQLNGIVLDMTRAVSIECDFLRRVYDHCTAVIKQYGAA